MEEEKEKITKNEKKPGQIKREKSLDKTTTQSSPTSPARTEFPDQKGAAPLPLIELQLLYCPPNHPKKEIIPQGGEDLHCGQEDPQKRPFCIKKSFLRPLFKCTSLIIFEGWTILCFSLNGFVIFWFVFFVRPVHLYIMFMKFLYIFIRGGGGIFKFLCHGVFCKFPVKIWYM